MIGHQTIKPLVINFFLSTGIFFFASFGVTQETPESATSTASKTPRKTLFFYLQGNPEGLAFTYDLELPEVLGPFHLGINHAYYATAVAEEISLRYRYLGGLVDVLLGVGVETGFYYQTDNEPPPTLREELGPLRLGIKEFVRMETKFNLKLSRIWVYGRATPILRFRDFTETEPRRGISAVQNEFSFGYAGALLFRIWGKDTQTPRQTGYDPAGWLYAEYTGETVQRFASDFVERGQQITVDRPSLGLIVYSPFGWSTVSLNLDIYYSLLSGPLLDDSLFGLGTQLLLFWEL